MKIVMNVTGSDSPNMKQFLRALGDCKGKARVILELKNDDESMTMCLSGYSVDPQKASDALNNCTACIICSSCICKH